MVVAPDSSSNEFDIHKELQERGIDVLIIDHHEAPKVSEYACVINNQLCDYPNKSLSGVGMVYKFCKYFDLISGKNYVDDLMDLAALGLVGDMMDLRPYETRYLVNEGIKKITNPFLQAMVIKQEYFIKGSLNPHKLAFYIVPGINSITRVGTIEEKLILFESMIEFKAYELIPSTKRGAKIGDVETRVEQSCRNCTNIRNRQNRSKEQIVEEIDNIIKTKNLLDNKLLVVKITNPINSDITGLVANQIANKYQRPTLILNKREDRWGGSGRNYANSPIKDFRKFLLSTGLVISAQGHSSAFGCEVSDSTFNDFIQKTNELLKDIEFNNKYDIDLIYEGGELENDYIDLIDIAECEDLWGQNIEEPLFLFKDIKVTKDNLFLFGESVLKIDYGNFSFLSYGGSDVYNLLYTDMGCVNIDIIGTCCINSYDGKLQIKIVDYEITRKVEY